MKRRDFLKMAGLVPFAGTAVLSQLATPNLIQDGYTIINVEMSPKNSPYNND